MRFGDFRVDVESGELFRNDVRVKLQDLPFRVLAALLETPGEVVTREQLRTRLWGAETFVDAEAGLNTAVAKLREALGDSADVPRFIETLPKRGYRFRAPVDSRADASMPLQPLPEPATAPAPAPSGPARRHRAALVVALSIAAALLSAWALRLSKNENATIAVLLFHNETGDPGYDQLAQQLTDATVVTLASTPRLDVIGNAAILRTPRIFADIQKIGRTLRADFVVVGQLQREGDDLVVRTHFIRVSDQKHLWAHPTSGDPATLDRQVPIDVAHGIEGALDRSR